MSTLRKTQDRMAKAILEGKGGTEGVLADGLDPDRRVEIYRNHFRATLNEALAATFPVTAKLVGAGFFLYMTAAFTAAHPPHGACVSEYGEEFPGFIAGFAPAASVPPLSDVAMMEWLLNEALQATSFEGKMFYSCFPLARIWETNQEDYTGDATVDLDAGGGWIVVRRDAGLVKWQWYDLPKDRPPGTKAQDALQP